MADYHVGQPSRLRANALSFSSLLTQGITHIAPAMGLVVTVQFVTTMAGIGRGFKDFFVHVI